jgi:hypothetical protein
MQQKITEIRIKVNEQKFENLNNMIEENSKEKRYSCKITDSSSNRDNNAEDP